jgi:hypothetical protein
MQSCSVLCVYVCANSVHTLRSVMVTSVAVKLTHSSRNMTQYILVKVCESFRRTVCLYFQRRSFIFRYDLINNFLLLFIIFHRK